jgi:hypothetical protein
VAPFASWHGLIITSRQLIHAYKQYPFLFYNEVMPDLFDHAMQERMKQEAPLAARMRPHTS